MLTVGVCAQGRGYKNIYMLISEENWLQKGVYSISGYINLYVSLLSQFVLVVFMVYAMLSSQSGCYSAIIIFLGL